MNRHELQAVDFLRPDGAEIDGLVSVKKPPRQLSADEAAVIQQAGAFPEITYVFFRRVSDNRSSIPVAFVVDNDDEHLTNHQLAKLHNDLWLHGTTPLIYIAWPTRIDILTCARGPDFWDAEERGYHPAESLRTASLIDAEFQKLQRFSAHRLADGTFWEDPQNRSLADHEKAAHETLIQAIVDADQALEGDANPLLRRLLLLMVLIKYLEDREVFPRPSWFAHYHKGARCFFDVIKWGEPEDVLRLLRTLEEKFNGDVFSLPENTILTKKSLRHFAALVEARTVGRERFLWEQFSFAHLPVEVISHLYQRFVQGSTAVYTPPFLAALLLDYAMPYKHLTGRERVLDPSCGSGIFLVGAFRRLVNFWKSTHQSKTLDVEVLKSILRNQIFGVELDSNAVDLTAFSLALALCDCLQPNVIWNELRFDPLRSRNIREADFFDCVSTDAVGATHSIGTFDVILGNPPFESKFSAAANRVNAARADTNGCIPDNQIAYLFLEQSMKLLNPGGRLCLIQNSGLLYNSNAHAIRCMLAKSQQLMTVLDFASIRGLYEGADPKTCAIVLSSDANSVVSHLTFRRTYETDEKLGFEIDHYERHQLCIDDIIANPSIFRIGLLGGGRLRHVSARFRQMQTLEQFAERNNWEYGEGFIAASSGRRTPAPFLTGMLQLPSKALNANGIDPTNLSEVSAEEFRSAYTPERYAPPLLLIKKHEDLHFAIWVASSLAYKAQIVGLHPRDGNKAKFKRFVTWFHAHHHTLRFAVALNGSRGLGVKATAIEKQDIDILPCPDDASALDLAEWEKVLQEDTLNLFLDFVRLGQDSSLLLKSAGASDLVRYSELFCRMLGSIYDNLHASAPIELGSLICLPFYFGEEPSRDLLGLDSREYLSQLVYSQSFESLRTIRVVRIYHDNILYIIKPNRLRYWIGSTAIRDADDTLIDLQQQGY